MFISGLHVFPTFVLYELTILVILTLSLVILKVIKSGCSGSPPSGIRAQFHSFCIDWNVSSSSWRFWCCQPSFLPAHGTYAGSYRRGWHKSASSRLSWAVVRVELASSLERWASVPTFTWMEVYISTVWCHYTGCQVIICWGFFLHLYHSFIYNMWDYIFLLYLFSRCFASFIPTPPPRVARGQSCISASLFDCLITSGWFPQVYLLVLSVTTLSLLLAPALWRAATLKCIPRVERKTSTWRRKKVFLHTVPANKQHNRCVCVCTSGMKEPDRRPRCCTETTTSHPLVSASVQRHAASRLKVAVYFFCIRTES